MDTQLLVSREPRSPRIIEMAGAKKEAAGVPYCGPRRIAATLEAREPGP